MTFQQTDWPEDLNGDEQCAQIAQRHQQLFMEKRYYTHNGGNRPAGAAGRLTGSSWGVRPLLYLWISRGTC